MDKMALLRAEHISKSYGEKHVLQDISIHLDQGELVSLLGVSGSGKTTLFHILSGLVTPDNGKVYLRDNDVTSTPGSISYMLQKDLLLPHKKVIDNVPLPLVLKGVKKTRQEKRHIRYLQRLAWKEPSTKIRSSFPAVCAREQPCFVLICPQTVLRFWMNRSVRLIR